MSNTTESYNHLMAVMTPAERFVYVIEGYLIDIEQKTGNTCEAELKNIREILNKSASAVAQRAGTINALVKINIQLEKELEKLKNAEL